MLPSLFRWWWEFFHSILGDTAFAKFLAGALALVVTPVAFFAVLGSIALVLSLVLSGIGPRADRLAMRFAYYIRDLFKR
jgi:hypothetical protein